jgi:hypothetical protein
LWSWVLDGSGRVPLQRSLSMVLEMSQMVLGGWVDAKEICQVGLLCLKREELGSDGVGVEGGGSCPR